MFFSHQQQVLSRYPNRVGEGIIILIFYKLLRVCCPYFDLNRQQGKTIRPRITSQPATSTTRVGVLPHLVLCDLHVQDDVVDEFGQSLLHCALELVVLQQRVDKLEDAEHQILKTQNFTCKSKNTI